jgi:hypothetical protein
MFNFWILDNDLGVKPSTAGLLTCDACHTMERIEVFWQL